MPHNGHVDGDLSVIRFRGYTPASTTLSYMVPLVLIPLRMKLARRRDFSSLAGVFALKRFL